LQVSYSKQLSSKLQNTPPQYRRRHMPSKRHMAAPGRSLVEPGPTSQLWGMTPSRERLSNVNLGPGTRSEAETSRSWPRSRGTDSQCKGQQSVHSLGSPCSQASGLREHMMSCPFENKPLLCNCEMTVACSSYLTLWTKTSHRPPAHTTAWTTTKL
jgi:hypothetical protein